MRPSTSIVRSLTARASSSTAPLRSSLAAQRRLQTAGAQQSSISDPAVRGDAKSGGTRDGRVQRSPPKGPPQELEPSLGSSTLLRSTPELVSHAPGTLSRKMELAMGGTEGDLGC